VDKATQATTPTAPKPIKTATAQRSAYKRASALAARIVDRLTILPRDVEVRSEVGGAYGLRLHFGAGRTAARGVLEVAGIADTDPTRDASSAGLGVYIECHATVEGIPLIARALVTQDDADQLLQQTPTQAAPTPQAVRLGTSAVAQVASVVTLGGEA
jgi:hypothetical protein